MKYLTWILLLIILFGGSTSWGQGWIKEYTGDHYDFSTGFFDIVSTSDGGYMAIGAIRNSTQNSAGGLSLFKLDSNGDTLWVRRGPKEYNSIGTVTLGNIKQTSDGGYLLSGVEDIAGILSAIHVVKTNSIGDSLWTLKFYDASSKIEETHDGGFLVFSGTSITKLTSNGQIAWKKQYSIPNVQWFYVNSCLVMDSGFLCMGAARRGSGIEQDLALIRINNNGDTLWTKTIDIEPNNSNLFYFVAHSPITNGNFLVGGRVDTSTSFQSFLVQLDTSGTLLWKKKFGVLREFVQSINLTASNDYILTHSHTWSIGGSIPTVYPSHLRIAKVNALGNEIWQKYYGGNAKIHGFMSRETSDKGIIIAGRKFSPQDEAYAFVIKTDSTGETATNTLSGNIFEDINNNCTKEATEPFLSSILIKATNNTTGSQYYTTPNVNGDYSFNLGLGTYTVAGESSFNPYKDYTCLPSSSTITFNTLYQQQNKDFTVGHTTLCPLLNVDISAPFIRATGGGSAYTVSYCNRGTADAQNVYVEVLLDPALHILSSSIPVSNQAGNLYTFNIDTVTIGECGSFRISMIADTTATFGQTFCTKAYIYPDSICIPSYWTGPILDVTGLCANDTVDFTIQNKGAPMSQGTQYFVYEDNVMFRTGTTNSLGTSGSQLFREYAQPGKSYRFEVKQTAGFPALLGDSVASASIEGCQPLANGTFSTGFITQLSNGNSSPFIAVDCQPMVAAYDPNDKQAQPEGYATSNYIYDYTPLDYKIRFQNTGTDTAFRVVIRDTLSAHLDVSSLTMGAASHNYSWRIYGEGILEVTFANIMLPDSNVNEAASHGFFKFRINQVPNNPLGAVIYNRAGIYFDYNPPIITNTTQHTIGDNFVMVNIITNAEETIDKDIDIKIYPNPFREQATLEVAGGNYQELTLNVYDAMGRHILQQHTTNNKIQIQKGNLPQGVYIYQLQGDGKLINMGKMVIK